MVSITGTLVGLGTGLDATMSVGVNGFKSILSIFMQFLPVILIIGIVLWIVSFILGQIKGISFGGGYHHSKGTFKSSQKH